ncbi:MAG TPA: hypothetical protein VHS05_15455 [Pyrinomonadaceae bacterium]|jgi:hypothetical protein|nr:hypothetical protein [Pyrinomonadaceae bacterium]
MSREIVSNLDRQFAALLNSLKDLASSVPAALLYRNPPAVSIGENILRSAAALEQTCGGLTSNLWDDPFEWTLPETLSNGDLIVDYLSEVDRLRQRAFNSISDDSALTRYVSTPAGERPLVELLLETLLRSSDQRGRAVATIKILSGEGTPRFII